MELPVLYVVFFVRIAAQTVFVKVAESLADRTSYVVRQALAQAAPELEMLSIIASTPADSLTTQVLVANVQEDEDGALRPFHIRSLDVELHRYNVVDTDGWLHEVDDDEASDVDLMEVEI